MFVNALKIKFFIEIALNFRRISQEFNFENSKYIFSKFTFSFLNQSLLAIFWKLGSTINEARSSKKIMFLKEDFFL